MAVTYNTTIDQGADWYINFTYEQVQQELQSI
jgi:hypothetical protein